VRAHLHRAPPPRLARYPLELVDWPTDNSRRLDLRTDDDMLPGVYWSDTAIPRDESDALRWSGCPFAREAAGGGTWEEDPVHFLLAYWIGCWTGLAACPTAAPPSASPLHIE
jgi:hypothetical protein